MPRDASVPLAPMPSGHWLWGHLAERTRDPLGLFLRSQRELGDVVRYRMGHLRVEQLTHPDHVRHVLQSSKDTYGKGDTWDKTRPLVGDGLLTSAGPVWKQQRRIAQPAFHPQPLARLVPAMTDATQQLVERWAPVAASGGELNVFDEMRDLTIGIVIRSLFGLELDDRVPTIANAFAEALAVTNRRITSPLPYLPRLYALPSRDNLTFRRSVAALNGVVSGIVAQRARTERAEEAPEDLLGLLLASTRSELGEIDQRQLRDEAVTLLLAGFETTASALAWALDLLDQHPEVAERLESEADQVLGDRLPTAADLDALVYARAVFEETLRLRPPVWALPRVALTEDVVDGHRIPAGDLVILVPYVTHRHRDFWPDPDRFDPTRFLPENRKAIARGAYLPFGAGQRQCLGLGFAIMEAQLVLAMIAQRFRLRAEPGTTVRPEPSVTLKPSGPMPMRVHERQPAAGG